MKIMLLDPGWPQTGYLMVYLVSAGFEVTRVAAGAFDKMGLGGYCRNIERPEDELSSAYFVELIREQKPDLVIPLCEEYQMMLWNQSEDITSKVFPKATAAQQAALADRPTMYQLAERAGVPIPRSIEITDESALATAAELLGFPLVLRGTQGLGGVQVKIVHNSEEALAAYQELQSVSPGAPFAQTFVSGRRCLIGGLFDQGEMLQWFSQTTLESFSPPTGPSVRVRSMEDPILTDYAKRVFREFGWNGLACAEFMRTEDGRYYFLEINPRPWAAIQAAHVCGIPLMKSFAQYLKGQRPTQKSFKRDRVVNLFPQYLIYRFSQSGALSWRDLRNLLSSLWIAPWSHPRLVLHYLRITRWYTRRP